MSVDIDDNSYVHILPWDDKALGSAQASMSFRLSEQVRLRLNDLFTDTDPESGIAILKAQLNHMGFSVPTLFKQYTK